MILERMIQKEIPGKWAELEALDQKYNVVEARLGYPPKRRYRCMVGGHTTDTIIIEREWDSVAAMEAAYSKAFTDPEHQALNAESISIITSVQDRAVYAAQIR
jgi:hypothetical protein